MYIYIGSALWNILRILRPAPLRLRYHRALCQASNVKEPTRFMVTSWIVRSDEGHNSAIWSLFLFRYRTSTSATLCQDEKYIKNKKKSLAAKIGFLQHFLNDKTSCWLFGGKRLIAKHIRGNFYTLWSFHFFFFFKLQFWMKTWQNILAYYTSVVHAVT